MIHQFSMFCIVLLCVRTEDHSNICTVIYLYQYVSLIRLYSYVYLHAFRTRVCFPPMSSGY